MKAVEEFFDKRHNVLIKFGGLFSALFLSVYVPVQAHFDSQEMLQEKTEQIEVLQEQLQEKQTEIVIKDKQVELLNQSFEEQKVVMQQVECLAKNIYFEAGGETHKGKLAVAEVTMNRVHNKLYPKTVCGVVYQKYKGVCQFSWVCQGKSKVRSTSAWSESKQIAQNILIGGKDYNTVGNALHFHATHVYPSWASTKKLIARIGNHVFYH
jgi:spore germination cell wall hydrolase CwlJ-like protein